MEEIGNIAKRPVKANLWGGGYKESGVSAPQAGHQQGVNQAGKKRKHSGFEKTIGFVNADRKLNGVSEAVFCEQAETEHQIFVQKISGDIHLFLVLLMILCSSPSISDIRRKFAFIVND